MRRPSVSTVLMVLALTGMATGVVMTGNACPRPAQPTTAVATFPTQTPGEAKLLFVGDLSTAREVGETIDAAGKGDPRFMFENMRATFDAHDLVFANLECVVSDSDAEEATQKTTRIRSLTKHAAQLKAVGVDVVSVANNHAMDFGEQGFQSTLAEMTKQGIVPVGALHSRSAFEPVTIVDVGGFKVGFLAYNQHTDEYTHPPWRPTAAGYSAFRVRRDIAAARPLVDYLVVSVHGGRELSHEPVDWQIDDANAALDAGADAWVGHHPHVVQPYLVRPDHKVIAYSLGDFLFDKASPWLAYRNRARLFLSLTLTRDAQGAVLGTPHFLAGDQELDTFRPIVGDSAFDVASFDAARSAPPTFRDRLRDAEVVRVVGEGAAAQVHRCDRWEEKRAPIPKHGFRWLAPRFGCGVDEDDDAKKGWLSVAPTVELFDRQRKPAIWAHPHAGGPLRITFPHEMMGRALVGFAGVGDWGAELDAQARAAAPAGATPQGLPPVSIRVVVDGAVDATVEVGAARAPTPLRMDTSALAGQARDVVVEVRGGTGDNEGRFFFDLWSEP